MDGELRVNLEFEIEGTSNAIRCGECWSTYDEDGWTLARAIPEKTDTGFLSAIAQKQKQRERIPRFNEWRTNSRGHSPINLHLRKHSRKVGTNSLLGKRDKTRNKSTKQRPVCLNSPPASSGCSLAATRCRPQDQQGRSCQERKQRRSDRRPAMRLQENARHQ